MGTAIAQDVAVCEDCAAVKAELEKLRTEVNAKFWEDVREVNTNLRAANTRMGANNQRLRAHIEKLRTFISNLMNECGNMLIPLPTEDESGDGVYSRPLEEDDEQDRTRCPGDGRGL